jgi:P-type Ca2+ transporter type 2B
MTIDTRELVVGDVIQLRSGEKIPADCIFLHG